MKKTLAVLATAVMLGVTSMTVPAHAHRVGPGLAFGLAVGALTAGAIAATQPYYGYYGPRYYGPSYYYGPGPHAYYGGPYYRRHRHWHHW